MYLESSVFLAVINGESNGPEIRALLKELKIARIRIYTSIITVQEIAVLSLGDHPKPANEGHLKTGQRKS